MNTPATKTKQSDKKPSDKKPSDKKPSISKEVKQVIDTVKAESVSAPEEPHVPQTFKISDNDILTSLAEKLTFLEDEYDNNDTVYTKHVLMVGGTYLVLNEDNKHVNSVEMPSEATMLAWNEAEEIAQQNPSWTVQSLAQALLSKRDDIKTRLRIFS